MVFVMLKRHVICVIEHISVALGVEKDTALLYFYK